MIISRFNSLFSFVTIRVILCSMHSDLYLPVKGASVRYPWLWLGTWSLGGEGFGKHDLSESKDVITQAFEIQ